MQQPILLVGRHPEVDVRVDSATISRRHCCLAVVNDKVLIRDLGSRHGVYLNGVRIEEAEVRQGDEIAIGHLIYRFEADAPRPASRPTPAAKPEASQSDTTEPILGLIPIDENYDDDLVALDD